MMMMAPHIATTTRNNSMMRPPMPGRKMRRRGNVFLNAGGKADDDDMNKTAPFRLPNSLWTNQKDLKTPEQKCSDIYQSYATMAATRLVMAQDDGFGNECSEDVNVSETTSKILTHKEKKRFTKKTRRRRCFGNSSPRRNTSPRFARDTCCLARTKRR